MALIRPYGGYAQLFGIGQYSPQSGGPQNSLTTLDAANEAVIYYGYVFTSDGGSHTIDTSGSSSLQWATGSVTFSNGSTTVNVGLAALDTSSGPPARAVNSSNVITFDVSASFTGGGGGITASAWQTSVPTTGSKTVANGDFIAFAVQMTARGGSDSIAVAHVGGLGTAWHAPGVTNYTGGSYSAAASNPNCFIVFSDGATGWFCFTDVCRAAENTRTFNSGSSPNEYGQLYKFPFPVRISGIYTWVDPDANFDLVLYSDPLGTPVAEKTISIDANAVALADKSRFFVPFAAPYTLPANTPIVAAIKPGGSNVGAHYKILGSAATRVTDVGGTESYGVSRSSGAFADAASSLHQYYIGLLVSHFEHGVWPSGNLGV